MYTTITIFYASLVGMIIMIMLKRREIVTGKAGLVSKAGAGSDHLFQNAFFAVRRGLSYVNWHTFTALFQWAAFHLLRGIRAIYVEIKYQFIKNPHGKKLIDAVRGRGEVKDHGVSFYLRRIAADDK